MRKKMQLFRLPNGTIAYLEMNSVDQILKDKGLDANGDAQRFHTANVLKRVKRYMPFVSGLPMQKHISIKIVKHYQSLLKRSVMLQQSTACR